MNALEYRPKVGLFFKENIFKSKIAIKLKPYV